MPWVCVQSKWSSKQFPLLKLLCKRIVWLGLSMLEQLANRTFSNPWQRDNLIASSLPRDLSYRNPAGFRTLWTHYLLSGFIFAFAQKYILRLLNRKDPMSSVEEKFAATWWDLVDCSNNSWHLRPMRFHTGPWVNVHPVIGHNMSQYTNWISKTQIAHVSSDHTCSSALEVHFGIQECIQRSASENSFFSRRSTSWCHSMPQ